MMEKPIWYDYIVWDVSDELMPIAKGFKKDTPPEIIRAYKKDLKEYQAQVESDPDAKYI